MATEGVVSPEQIALPESESASLRLKERQSNELERPTVPVSDKENDTPEWVTMTFRKFLEIHWFSSSWIEMPDLAVQDLRFGGMVTIPRPSSSVDLTTILRHSQISDSSARESRLGAFSDRIDFGHAESEACSNWAEIAWNHWQEYKNKPLLVVFEATRVQEKFENWMKEDVINDRREETVKMWVSRHHHDDLASPALISAEFHLLLNGYFVGSHVPDHLRVLIPHVTSKIILEHMGSFQEREELFRLVRFPVFYHRIRMFAVTDSSDSHGLWDYTHRREKGRFPANGSATISSTSARPWFTEVCISVVGGFRDRRDGSTLRSVLVMRDEVPLYPVDIDLSNEVRERLSAVERIDFLPVLLHQYYALWERCWNSCLNGIDDSVMITLEDLSDNTKLDTFMFDGSNFERSRSYFAAIQLLRIFSDRVKETKQDLILAVDQLGQDLSLFKLTGLEEAESRLLQRIDRKTEEIKTLRDGLFNSTSVREATRATQMNRYVIVFTVVTVLYTPPSFISALFATPLPYFTKGDPDDFKRAVGIATGTTVLAAIILLVIANSFDDVVRNPKDRLTSMVELTRTKGRSLLKKSQSFAWVPLQTVQESGHALREFAGKAVGRMGRVGQGRTQDTAPQQSRGQTEQRHRGLDIHLPDRTANAATPSGNDHGGLGGNIV